ncbi:uL22 family ribosomal protein [Candidatus Vidania fulgoroideorum]
MVITKIKRINLSVKKIKVYLKYIKRRKIKNIINFLTTTSGNKISYTILRVIRNIINTKNIEIKNIYSNNSIKRIKRNYRAKGKMDKFTKKYCNINILWETK